MDNGYAQDVAPSAQHELSYDDTIPYGDQVAPEDASSENPTHGPSLANRIGTTKVYLLSDTSSKASRLGKRKVADMVDNAETFNGDVHGEGEVEDGMDIDQDPILRANAILMQGSPIAHLPTARIFDYAAHFDVHPLGLEWIDDTTCIFVFSSKQATRSAFLALQKPSATASTSPPSDDTLAMSTTDLTTARPIPVSLWPPEDRIHHSLGVGKGLKGTLTMRWARVDDKKKRGAKNDSAFYKKHGSDAGKESAGFGVVPASAAAAAAVAGVSGEQDSLARRLSKVGDTLEERIPMDDGEEVEEKAGAGGVREWDRGKPGLQTLEKRISLSGSVERKRKRGRREDADEFLGHDLEDEEMHAGDRVNDVGDIPESPPSKMRSDYIAKDGWTIIGSNNGNGPGLADRIMARLPRRARRRSPWSDKRGGRGEGENDKDWVSARVDDEGRGRQSRRRGGRNKGNSNGSTCEPPRKKTREELDEELEAFLNDRT